jgi:hypothetical protein
MSLYAMVVDAYPYVADLIEWDGTTDYWVPPAGVTMVLADDKFVSPGFTYDSGTGEFLQPPQGTVGSVMAAELAAKAGK